MRSGCTERAWLVGDLTPEELDEIGPDAAPEPPPAWTQEEYKAQMLRRGIVDAHDGIGLGVDGYLELAEAFGILEKRPDTLPAPMNPSSQQPEALASELDSFGSLLTVCFPSELRRWGPA